MTHRIRLHAGARADLEATQAWVFRFAGPAAARRRIAEIEAAIARLAVLPHRGTRRDEVLPGLRAVPVGARCVVAFVVDDEAQEMRVLAVSYGGSDWMGRARERA